MKKCINLSVGKTTIKKEPDYDADTSYLGEYGDKLKPGCIIRADRTFYEDIPDYDDSPDYEVPEMSRVCSFFYPPDNGEIPGTPEYKKYALQDYENMENLNNQQWGYVAIVVKTTIKTDMGLSDEVINSLCGIEDHWDKDSKNYIDEIITDLKAENKAELLKMGFSEKEIDESLNNADEVE
jgi:hypothetical protein